MIYNAKSVFSFLASYWSAGISALASYWLEDWAIFTPMPEENDQYSANHS
jgi:hypothetical protein